jgi:two-component sensor histidine kinase
MRPTHDDVGYSFDLARRAAPARYARDVLKRMLHQGGVIVGVDEGARERAEAALLLVSELVTNACRHTAGPGELRFALRARVLTIEVDDTSRVMPTRVPSEDRGPEGGYGMLLIEKLADSWHVERHSDGKTVQVRLSFGS